MREDLLRNYTVAFSTLSHHEWGEISVRETDEQDCQRLFSFFRTGPYPVEIEGDEQRAFPAQVEEFLALYHPPRGYLYTPVWIAPLRIDKEHLDIHFSCSSQKSFTFSLDPDRFQGETTGGERIARLHEFIRTIGQLLNKEIYLTPQALSRYPLFRFDPKTGEEHWFLEPPQTME